MSESQFVTYAQNGEDVLLWRALKHVPQGFYIDVGAQDPVVDSVTKAFYDRGWSGINIEPVQYWYRRLIEQRQRDVNLCVAASDRAGTLKLYESDVSGLSTSDERFALAASRRGWKLHESMVPCMTLSEICAKHVTGPVHFMKVDCEGAEAATLRGMSLDRTRPWIVLVEANEPNSTMQTHMQWESLLTNSGYEFVYADGVNRYYVAHEHPRLRTVFGIQPNALDNFIHASELRARELQREVVGLRSELQGQNAEIYRLQSEYRDVTGEREFLRTQLVTLEKHRRAYAAEISRLQEEYKDISGERVALLTRLAGVQMSLASQAAEISRLREQYRQVTESRETIRAELAGLQSEYSALHTQFLLVLASHSWRLTSPLRATRRAFRMATLVAARCAAICLRPVARALRPMLRKMLRNDVARRIVIGIFGQHSAIARHGRLFLFGAAPHNPVELGPEPGPATQLTAAMWSRRERIVWSELRRVGILPSGGCVDD